MFRGHARQLFVVGLIAAAVLAGCSTAPGSSPAPSQLANTDWLLATIGGKPVTSGTNADLLFGLHDASGFSGCNRFTTTYTTDGASSLSFGNMATTRMACDPATNVIETGYLAALGNVARYAMTSDSLTLANASGGTLLTYSAQAPASVEGPWNVTMVNNGVGAVESVPTGIAAAISFLPEGTVEGFGGCNNFSGGYSVTGDKIAIGPLMSSMKACDDATNKFEAQFLMALQNSAKWSVTTGTLDLRDANGAQQVAATTAIGH